ncbi:hypothetical protein AVEN_255775-1 [Araneus ventricosus]|uniref:RNase H type-1 domain-containing protein n=1 Tax=Araneus ventricosus TaxID=182803 RepID=A0A4Y2P5P3_ARAVE|nr:hypothetical protein AVEN_255775-1 [Araneus ventricosus]
MFCRSNLRRRMHRREEKVQEVYVQDFADFEANQHLMREAELAAINFAAVWALERNVKIKVFSDSKSSIEAIRSPKVKSNFVLSVKDNLYNAKDLVSLVWVKAHCPGYRVMPVTRAMNWLNALQKLLLLVGPICLYLLLILM